MISNGVLLQPIYAYNILQESQKQKAFALSNNHVIFITGKHIVIQNTKTQSQQFIFRGMSDQEILTTNFIETLNKSVLLVCQKTDTPKLMKIVLHSLNDQKQRIFNYEPKQNNHKIYYICFSGDANYIFIYLKSVNNEHDILQIYDTFKFQLINTVTLKQVIKQMDTFLFKKKSIIAIQDNFIIIIKIFKHTNKTSTYKYLPFYKHNEKNKQPIIKYYQNVNTKMVIVAFVNFFQVYIEDSFIQEIAIKENYYSNPNEYTRLNDDICINIIASFNYIIIIGLSNCQTLLIFEMNQKGSFSFRSNLNLNVNDDKPNVYFVHQSLDSKIIALTLRSLKHSQEECVDYAQRVNTQIQFIDCEILEAIKFQTGEEVQALFGEQMMKSPILKACICQNIKRVFFITKEKHVESIDYGILSSPRMCTKLPKQAISMDVHPQGFQLCVGFEEGYRVFVCIEEDFTSIFDNSSSHCGSVQYALRGDRLAVSSGGNMIIHDVYTLQVLFTFQSNINISDIQWKINDKAIVVLYENGKINVYDMNNYTREYESFSKAKRQTILAIDYDNFYDIMLYSTSAKNLYMCLEKGDIEQMVVPTSPVKITCLKIVLEFEIFFAGCSDGNIRMYLYPPILFNNKLQHVVTLAHQGPITSLILTPDKSQLISSSSDTSIYIYKIFLIDDIQNYLTDDTGSREVGSNSLKYYQDTENPQVLFLNNKYNDFNHMSKDINAKIDNMICLDNYSIINKDYETKQHVLTREKEFEVQQLKNEIEDELTLSKQHNKNIKKKFKIRQQTLTQEIKQEFVEILDFYQNKEQVIKNQIAKLEIEKQENQKQKQLDYEIRLIQIYEKQDNYQQEMYNFIQTGEEKINEINYFFNEKISQIKNQFQTDYDIMKKKQSSIFEQNNFLELKQQEITNQIYDEQRKDFELQQKYLETKFLTQLGSNESQKMNNFRLQKEKNALQQKFDKFERLIKESKIQNRCIQQELNELINIKKEFGKELSVQENKIFKQESTIKEIRQNSEFLMGKKQIMYFICNSFDNQQNEFQKQLMSQIKHFSDGNKLLQDEFEKEREMKHILQSSKTQMINIKQIITSMVNDRQNIKKKIDRVLFAFFSDINNISVPIDGFNTILDNPIITEIHDIANRHFEKKIFQKLSKEVLIKNNNIHKYIINSYNLGSKRSKRENSKNNFFQIGSQKEKEDNIVSDEINKKEIDNKDQSFVHARELVRMRKYLHKKTKSLQLQIGNEVKNNIKQVTQIQRQGNSIIDNCIYLKNKHNLVIRQLQNDKIKAQKITQRLKNKQINNSQILSKLSTRQESQKQIKQSVFGRTNTQILQHKRTFSYASLNQTIPDYSIILKEAIQYNKKRNVNTIYNLNQNFKQQ